MDNNENLNRNDEELINSILGENTDPASEVSEMRLPTRRPRKKKNVKKIVLIVLIVLLSLVLITITAAFLYADYVFGLLENSGKGTEHTGDPTYDPWATTGSFETFYTFPSDNTDFTDPSGSTGIPKPTIPTEGTNPNHSSGTSGTEKPTIPQTSASTQRPTTSTTVPPVFPTVPPISMDENILNIMLLGLDKGGKRSDSMMLCTINTRTKTITLTSFMRDLLVTVPGKTETTGYQYKLNAAYAMGGRKMLEETLLYNFGVKIDDFVTIRMDKFPTLIDYVGGVDINLTTKEAEVLNGIYDTSFVKGVNHLDGKQALSYSRIRKIDSDHQRVGRQQKVLEAIFKAYKDKSVLELNSLMLKILNAEIISTTMTKDEMWGYAGSMFPMLSGFTMDRKKVPDYYWRYDVDGDGEKEMMYKDAYYKGQAVLVPNFDVCRKYLEQILNP